MRVLNGQVHLLELAVLAIATLFGFAFGYSLPLFAAILIIFWPLLLLQLLVQGLFEALIQGGSKLYRKWRPRPPAPPPAPREPRTGIARFIWYLPLLAVTLGYARHVYETGRWFL